MLRRLIAPEYLFTLAVCTGLSPYLLTRFEDATSRYGINLTYLPLSIWAIAWISFLLGCILARRRRTQAAPLVFRPGAQQLVSAIAVMGMLAAVIQLYLARDIYGGLPIISYLTGNGAIDVGTANELQAQSAYGQFGC